MSNRPAFAFGKNWARFTRHHLDDDVLDIAQKSLVDFLGLPNLEGRSFLDVGCGSGLFSLAAYRLGASRIVSFDIDPDSVGCCKNLRGRAGNPAHWQVLEGSILDPAFVAALPLSDVVYSWGVLHHTGRMWEAINATASRMTPGGVFYLALYNRAQGWHFHKGGSFGPSTFWAREKRIYNALPVVVQRGIEGACVALWFGLTILHGQDPFERIRSYRLGARGMTWIVDVRDWLGGYPYEYATVEEVRSFCCGRLGLALKNLLPRMGTGNNEFLFARPQE